MKDFTSTVKNFPPNRWIWRLSVIFFLLVSFPSLAEKQIVRIGILAFNGPAYTIERWQPTIDHLNTTLTDFHFVIVPSDIPTLNNLVKDGLVSFTLTNGIQFLHYKYQFRSVKTLNLKPFHGDSRHAIGSAVISRSKEPEPSSWKQIRNRKIVSVSPEAFGGFRVMLREFIEEGVNSTDLSGLTFIGYPQKAILSKVLSGEADFAIAPTCLLERKILDGTIPPDALKVIRTKKTHPFPCDTSSRLYPNWTLARMNHVPAEYANQIAQSLLSIPADSSIATSGRYGGWTVPIDDTSIYQLLDDINVDISPFSIEKLWQKYRGWVLVSLGILFLFIVYHLRVNYLVHLRSSQLQEEIKQHKLTAEQLDSETKQLFKAQRILLTGELTSGISHELSQPLMAIATFSAGCRSRLSKQNISPEQLDNVLIKIEQQTQSAKELISRMRGFMQEHNVEKMPIDFRTILESSLLVFKYELVKHKIDMQVTTCPQVVFADPVMIQQVVVNIIRNSIDAIVMAQNTAGEIRITMSIENNLHVTIEDNGIGISQQQADKVFMPFNTSKVSGIGLGMVICKRIVESHDGTIAIASLTKGARVSFTLPLTKAKELS